MLALYMTYLDEPDDHRLFEDIYYAYRKQMVLLALSILGHKEDAEDAVSKVFLRIAEKNWNTVRSIRSDKDLRNYLLKATKNTALTMLETRKQIAADVDTVLELGLDGIAELSDDDFVEMICSRVEAQRVTKAICEMNEKYRNVLYYHFVLELSVPETARALGQTHAATKKQLVRGKKMLLKLLGLEGGQTHGNE